MKISFGLQLDGGNWPEFAEGHEAEIGDVSVGQSGLINLLETHLGLVSVPMPEALRIRQYMVRIQSLPNGSRFYSDSFAFDAWASARELLGWRDELVFHGWNPEAENQPERIAAIAEIERASNDLLADGLSDRVRKVMDALGERPELPIHQITLQDPLHLLPTPWKCLVKELQACGVDVDDAVLDVSLPEEIILLESEHVWPQAQAVASWLKVADATGDIALLCQQDTTQLDQALHAQAQSATGQSMTSAQLGVFQLLPLVLENLWKPVRIDRLMELLSVPLSPVPAFAARRLIKAVAKKPGLESELWKKTMAEIEEKKCSYFIKDGMAEEQAHNEAKDFASGLDQWLRAGRVDIASEAPTAVVIVALKRLQKHLAGQSKRVPIAKVAMGHCRELSMILSNMRSIGKPLLDRIVDDVVGPGRSSNSLREAATWGVIGDVSQLTGTIDTLVWWGFLDPSAPERNVWTDAERQWLREKGMSLDEPRLDRERERYHWLSALARSRKMLLCRPIELNGAPVSIHPLWSEIEADARLASRCKHIRAIDLFTGSNPKLLGMPLAVEEAKLIPSPTVSAYKSFESKDISGPRKLSPTSLGNLFGCSFKWLMEDLGIADSDVMGFSRDSAMIGTLAHQVLEDVFSAGTIPDPDDARIAANTSYVRRVPEMAADLLLPENSAKYEDIRKRVSDAAEDIVRRFDQAGFDRVVCEQWIKTKLDGVPVNGRADVIAYNAENKPHIIDFKYSYGSNYYKGKIKHGRDVQLVTYARMLGSTPSPVAYYLIPRREMITMFPAFGADTVESEITMTDGWNRVRKTYSSAMGDIRNGKVVASGLFSKDESKQLEEEREADGEIYIEPPCRFCDFASLCGLNAGGEAHE